MIVSLEALGTNAYKPFTAGQFRVSEYNKHLKKAGEHIGRNGLEIIKMKTIVYVIINKKIYVYIVF